MLVVTVAIGYSILLCISLLVALHVYLVYVILTCKYSTIENVGTLCNVLNLITFDQEV